MSFETFMKIVDAVVVKHTGLGVYDFADAPWRDLYDNTVQGDDITDQLILETLADADDIAAELVRLRA